MAKVKAMYNYSYDYEGTRITFKKGEEFQLLTKANADWWQVRRWKEGNAQDIYVPAVYVQEVSSTAEKDIKTKPEPQNPMYENITDLKKKLKSLQTRENGDSKAHTPNSTAESSTLPPSVSAKPSSRRDSYDPQKTSPLHKPLKQKRSLDTSSKTAPNGVQVAPKDQKIPQILDNEYAEPISPSILRKLNKGGRDPSAANSSSSSSSSSSSVAPQKSNTAPSPHIKDGWMAGYALPAPKVSKPRSQSVDVFEGKSSRNTPTSPTVLEDKSLDSGARPTSPTGSKGGKSRVPPPVLPKVKAKPSRPKSMVVSPTEEYSDMDSSGASTNFSAAEPAASVFPKPSEVKRSTNSLPMNAQPILAKKVPTGESLSKSLDCRKGSTPTILNSEKPAPKRSFSLNDSCAPDSTPSPPATVAPPLPPGWTQHTTDNGHTYYHNRETGESSWKLPETQPQPQQLEKVAPRGWTKEINPITSTPIYTDSRTGERWSPASDGAGNFYYYNLAKPSLTVGELPEVINIHELPSQPSTPASPPENVYDTLAPLMESTTRSVPEATSSPQHHPQQPMGARSSQPVATLTSQLEVFASSLSSVLKKHGYLQRKKLHDQQGKKVKGNSWQKLYIILQDYQLFFYTDHKVAKEVPGAKPQSIFSLLQASVCPYTKEKKAKHVFQVSAPFGEQFLLQADAAAQMNDWYSTIQTAIDKANQDYKEHPEKFKGMEPPLDDSGENSPKSLKHGNQKRVHKSSRQQSLSDELMLEDEEGDPMDDPEISAGEKSVRIRSRLKKLMAKRPQLETLKSKGILEEPVFGCELAHLCERQATNVPKFLVHFMNHIEQNGLDVVGLYRLSGNAASIQKLRYLVEQEEEINLNDPDWADINIVTGCLKLYIRELPDPLVPFKMFRSFIDAARAPSAAMRIASVAARVKELPTPNYFTLKTLIIHLKKVVEMGRVNKMQATNLAIVFGPTVMRAEMDSLEMATLMPIQNGIMELMITEFDSIFRK